MFLFSVRGFTVQGVGFGVSYGPPWWARPSILEISSLGFQVSYRSFSCYSFGVIRLVAATSTPAFSFMNFGVIEEGLRVMDVPVGPPG